MGIARKGFERALQHEFEIVIRAAKEIAGKRSLYAPTSSFLPSSMQWKLPQKAFD
jgi:hypothetical protein